MMTDSLQIAWRTGVNLREFAYYDRPECMQWTTAQLQLDQLKVLSKIGVKLVRFYAVHRACSLETNLQQVGKALDLLKAHGMQAVVCVADALGTGFIVPGDEPYHNGPQGHLNKDYWHHKQYQQNYMPYVSRLIEKYAVHEAVAIWEIGNEYAIHPQPSTPNDASAFVEFVRDATALIKQQSPTKLTSTGLINTNQIAAAGADRAAFARQLHAIPTLDLMSLHVYAEDDEDHLAMIDVEAIKSLGKAFYVGELGAEIGRTDRPTFINNEMRKWQSRGAFSTLIWAFDVSPQDVGVSDRKAFARIFGDFDALRGVVKSFGTDAAPISAVSTTQPPATPPVTTTPTTPTAPNEPVQSIGERTVIPPTTTPPVTVTVRDELAWNADITIPDGTIIPPGSAFKKIWRVRNTGTTTWGAGCELIFVNGDRMGIAGNIPLPGAKPGEMVQISAMMTAPQTSGLVRSTWKARNPQGVLFPYELYAEINVQPQPQTTEPIGVSEARFVADVTIPDRQKLVPGQQFIKTWRIRNSGTTTWGSGYELVFIKDNQMGAAASVPMPPLAPGKQGDVSVSLIAPMTTGTYRSTWKPRDPHGNLFEFEMYLEIVV